MSDDDLDPVASIMSQALGSAQSGETLGEDPTREEMQAEVDRLAERGMESHEIGQQIGVWYVKEKNTEALDLLEEVLTETFEDYG